MLVSVRDFAARELKPRRKIRDRPLDYLISSDKKRSVTEKKKEKKNHSHGEIKEKGNVHEHG